MIHAQTLTFTPNMPIEIFKKSAHAILETNQNALIPKGPERLWIIDPSIETFRAYTSIYIGAKKRKCSQFPNCTHYIEVAHRAAYAPEIARYPRVVRAFIGYGHDHEEDFGDERFYDALGQELPPVTNEVIVENCWKGDPFFKEMILYELNLLTDSPEMKRNKEKRLEMQITAANSDTRYGVAPTFRALDKICAQLESLACFTNNGFPPNFDKKKTLRNMELRRMVVDNLNVAESYKLEFRDITDRIKWIIRNDEKVTDGGKVFGGEFRLNGLPPFAFSENNKHSACHVKRPAVRPAPAFSLAFGA